MKANKTIKSAKKVAVKAAPKTPASTKAKAKIEPKTTAPAKAPAATKKPTSGKKRLTRIVAHLDAGWGNMLYIRGEGAGLSWEQGVPMLCENDTEWHWVAETEDGPISFKFLINDEKWALGENITINAGDVHISEPIF